MSKDDLAANIEAMSLSELAALKAEAIQTAATIAPLEPNEAEKRVIALKREMSSHQGKGAGLRSRARDRKP